MPRVPKAAALDCWGGTCEYITTPRDFKVAKSGRYDDRLKLCVQQSVRDSALRQIDLLLRPFWDRLLNHDISDLDSSAWLQHPVHFPENH
jgi:hypothetical protein